MRRARGRVVAIFIIAVLVMPEAPFWFGNGPKKDRAPALVKLTAAAARFAGRGLLTSERFFPGSIISGTTTQRTFPSQA